MTAQRHETTAGLYAIRNHEAADQSSGQDRPSGHGGHSLMMILMCLPMLLIAGFLVVTGAGGASLIFALVCLGMMATMMLMMPRGHSHK